MPMPGAARKLRDFYRFVLVTVLACVVEAAIILWACRWLGWLT
jgi:hypothetical protein